MRQIDVPRELAETLQDGRARYIPASSMSRIRTLNDDLRTARDRAANLTEKAQRRFDQAREIGLAEGRQIGSDAALQELSDFRDAIKQHKADLAETATRLALEIVRDVLGALPVEQQITAMAMRASNRLKLGGTLTLRVAPDLAPKVESVFASTAQNKTNVDVIGDPTLEMAKARIDSSIGPIELDLGQQLDTLARALLPQDHVKEEAHDE